MPGAEGELPPVPNGPLDGGEEPAVSELAPHPASSRSSVVARLDIARHGSNGRAAGRSARDNRVIACGALPEAS